VSANLQENGKNVNAFTQSTTTTYFCSVFASHLAITLDMMSSMLANPLFKEDVVRREIQAVDNGNL
jgi:secreted Zn-dependent insulinase-like peptidase